MKIGVLIITKGDRPKFFEQAKYLIREQTLQPDIIEVVDEETNLAIDITYRYRVGCERLVNKGCDLIIFWEDDDFYKFNYIQTMLAEFVNNGRPDIIGIEKTIYYHIGINKYSELKHVGRASAFSTAVSKNIINIDFGNDNEAFFDLHLWKQEQLKKHLFTPINPICLGIKHGIGSCGGKGHLISFPYKNEDKDLSYLKSIVDNKSFEFYTKIK